MKRNRVVLKVEEYEHTFQNGSVSKHYRFVEVYSSQWKVDCKHWIERALKNDPSGIYRIYVEDN